MGRKFIKDNVTYHRMDINSNNIINKSRTVEKLKTIKSGGKGASYTRFSMYGEALPFFPPTSLLTKKQIKANKKEGPHSEGRSKFKSYNIGLNLNK